MGVGMDVVAYDVPAWGVGELYFRPEAPLPRASRAGSLPPAEPLRPSAGRSHGRILPRRARLVRRRRARGSGGRPSSRRWPRRCAEFPGARSSRTASWPLSPAASRPRAAGTFCAENNFPLVVPCHRVVSRRGSAATARSASSTSGACSLWRASTSDQPSQASRLLSREEACPVTERPGGAAAIEPRKACCRLAELSRSSAGRERASPRRRPHRVHLELASGPVARRAFSLLRSYGVPCEIRTYKRRAFEQGTLPAPPRGRRPRPPGAERGGRPRREPRAARAAAQAGRRPRLLPGAYLRGAFLAAGSASGPRNAHLELRTAAPSRRPSSPSSRPPTASPLAVYERSRRRCLRQGNRDDRRAARVSRRAGGGAAARRGGGRGSNAGPGEPARQRRPRQHRAHEPRRRPPAPRHPPPGAEGRLGELAPELGRSPASGSAPTLSLRELARRCDRPRRRPPPTAGWRGSGGQLGGSPSCACESGPEGKLRGRPPPPLAPTLRTDDAERGLNPTPDERRPALENERSLSDHNFPQAGSR